VIHEGFGQITSDERGRFTGVDRYACDLLGYDMPALLRRSIHDITHPDDRASSRPLLDRLRHHGEPFTITKRCLRADGTVIWVQDYVSLLRDARGRASFSALIRPVLPVPVLPVPVLPVPVPPAAARAMPAGAPRGAEIAPRPPGPLH